MSHLTTEQGVLFAGLSKKAVVARFDQRRSGSDGGAILLKGCDERLAVQVARRVACAGTLRTNQEAQHLWLNTRTPYIPYLRGRP